MTRGNVSDHMDRYLRQIGEQNPSLKYALVRFCGAMSDAFTSIACLDGDLAECIRRAVEASKQVRLRLRAIELASEFDADGRATIRRILAALGGAENAMFAVVEVFEVASREALAAIPDRVFVEAAEIAGGLSRLMFHQDESSE